MTFSPAAAEVCDGIDTDTGGYGNFTAARRACNQPLDGVADGTFWLAPDGAGAVETECDMTTDGAG